MNGSKALQGRDCTTLILGRSHISDCAYNDGRSMLEPKKFFVIFGFNNAKSFDQRTSVLSA